MKKQYNQHDQFFKSLFSHTPFAKELLQLIFSKQEINAYDWKKLKTEKDTFSNSTRADLIFSVPLKNKQKSKVKIFILLEHKSTYNVNLFRQLFRYQALLIEKSFNEYGKPIPIIPVVFYHGRKPWKWKLSFQEAFGDKNFLDIPVLSRRSMLDFRIRLLDIQDVKWEKVFKDESIKSRGAFYLLREVWSSTADLVFLRRVFNFFKDVLPKREDLILSILEYLVTGYRMKSEVWEEAEEEILKRGILKKGGYMDIRKYIAERAREEGRQKGQQEGWQKGQQEGWQKGQQEGWQKGQQEGRQKGQQEIILNMLKKSAKISFISEVTGVSEKEINKLKKENSG